MRVEISIPGGRMISIDDQVLAGHREALASREPPVLVRSAWAATRVVMRGEYARVPHSLERPGSPGEIEAAIDWERTIALRRRLDGLGFGIAEAMDTAQRFQIGWPAAERLIRETGALGLSRPFVAGAGIDHLAREPALDELAPAVLEQAALIRSVGGIPIVLPLVPLAVRGASEEEYVRVYGEIIRGDDGPLFLHWLGEMFLPALRGYFPGRSLPRILALDTEKVLGIKISLLDADLEVRLRRLLLPRGQVVLTGDDFHFARMILGGSAKGGAASAPRVEGMRRVGTVELALGDFSHALLGVLDAIAVPAGLALQHLALGDAARFLAILEPCETLGRAVFEAPTAHYKAGLAFLSWLEGLQENAMLALHEERAREREHYLRVAELAARAGVFTDATRTGERLSSFLSLFPRL
jgi:hypothetical protein